MARKKGSRSAQRGTVAGVAGAHRLPAASPAAVRPGPVAQSDGAGSAPPAAGLATHTDESVPRRPSSLYTFLDEAKVLFTPIALFTALAGFAFSQASYLGAFAEPLAGIALFIASMLWLELVRLGLRRTWDAPMPGVSAFSGTLTFTVGAGVVGVLVLFVFFARGGPPAFGYVGALVASWLINMLDRWLVSRGAARWVRPLVWTLVVLLVLVVLALAGSVFRVVFAVPPPPNHTGG